MESQLAYILSALKQVPPTTDNLKIAKGKYAMPRTWKEVLKYIRNAWQ